MATVFRVQKTKDFTVMSNHHLKIKICPCGQKGFYRLCLACLKIGIIPLKA